VFCGCWICKRTGGCDSLKFPKTEKLQVGLKNNSRIKKSKMKTDTSEILKN
jgi:hypothetical protein